MCCMQNCSAYSEMVVLTISISDFCGLLVCIKWNENDSWRPYSAKFEKRKNDLHVFTSGMPGTLPVLLSSCRMHVVFFFLAWQRLRSSVSHAVESFVLISHRAYHSGLIKYFENSMVKESSSGWEKRWIRVWFKTSQVLTNIDNTQCRWNRRFLWRPLISLSSTFRNQIVVFNHHLSRHHISQTYTIIFDGGLLWPFPDDSQIYGPCRERQISSS